MPERTRAGLVARLCLTVGALLPYWRANVGVRAVALPRGHHTVRFTYQSASFRRGLWISGAPLLTLAGWLAVAWRGARA